jgi:hypothetical protein
VSNIIGSVPNGKRTWDGVPLTKEPPRNIKPFHYPLPPPSGSRAGCPSVGPSRGRDSPGHFSPGGTFFSQMYNEKIIEDIPATSSC